MEAGGGLMGQVSTSPMPACGHAGKSIGGLAVTMGTGRGWASPMPAICMVGEDGEVVGEPRRFPW